MERKPSSPASTCNDARRFVPASVSTREPLGKSKAARFCRPDSLAPGGRQCKRPAIIRCSTSQRSPSTPIAIRLPIRRNSRTMRPSTLGNWRLHGSKQKGARQPHSLERLANDAWFECADVGGDVRQFRHDYQLARRTRVFATSRNPTRESTITNPFGPSV